MKIQFKKKKKDPEKLIKKKKIEIYHLRNFEKTTDLVVITTKEKYFPYLYIKKEPKNYIKKKNYIIRAILRAKKKKKKPFSGN